MTGVRDRGELWDFVSVRVKCLKYFVGFIRTVELVLIDLLRLEAWSVPLFELCCSVGRQ